MTSIYQKKTLKKYPSTRSLPTKMIPRISSLNGFIEELKYKKATLVKSGSSEGNEVKKDSHLFTSKYRELCKSMNILPVSLVKVCLSNLYLDLLGDRIKFTDWMAILKTIKGDRSLHGIAIRSRIKSSVVQEHIHTEKKAREVDRGSVFFTRFIINKIVESLAECSEHSRNFTSIIMERIPLNGCGIEILSEGLKKTQCLQHLSLQNCNIGDDGCLAISRALRNVPTLITLDLSFCNITHVGAQHISALIKSQEIRRFGECWKQSLRYREVDHDKIPGLQRITLNDNTNIGDAGLHYIIDVLLDDFWLRALDMQNCGITEDGKHLVLKLININSEIGIVDLRRNPQMDSASIAEIIQILSKNTTEEKAQFGWLYLKNNDHTISPSGSNITVSSCGSQFIWNKNSTKGKCSSPRIGRSFANSSEAIRLSVDKVKSWKQSPKNHIFEQNQDLYRIPESNEPSDVIKLQESIETNPSSETILPGSDTTSLLNESENTFHKQSAGIPNFLVESCSEKFEQKERQEGSLQGSSSDPTENKNLKSDLPETSKKHPLKSTAQESIRKEGTTNDIQSLFQEFIRSTTSTTEKRQSMKKRLYNIDFASEYRSDSDSVSS